MMPRIPTQEQIKEMLRGLTGQGKLIEAGFVGFRLAAIPPDAGQIQIDAMRAAFFAGALHLFDSAMQIVDPGEEITDADMEKMDMIQKELNEFGKALALRVAKPQGTG